MKKLLLSTALLALTTGAALAADLPTRKAPAYTPPPPPPPMWTGVYAGLNAGYGFGTNSNTQSVGYSGPTQFAAYNSGQVPNVLAATLPGTASINTGVGYALSANGSQNQNGFIGGGQIGYNYQWGSNFVIGLEADMQGTGIRGNGNGTGIGGNGYNSAIAADIPFGAVIGGGTVFGTVGVAQNLNTNFNSIGITSVNAGVNWMGTVRGRLGYLVTPTMLVYATGGLTYGGVYANVRNYAVENSTAQGGAIAVGTTGTAPIDGVSQAIATNYNTSIAPGLAVNSSANTTYFGGGTKSQTLVGWNVGGGLEWMFMPNWSLKAEGIYWNMGNMNVPTASYAAAINPTGAGTWGTVPNTAIGGTRVNYQGVIARMGLNYHFNFGGSAPIVAKY